MLHKREEKRLLPPNVKQREESEYVKYMVHNLISLISRQALKVVVVLFYDEILCIVVWCCGKYINRDARGAGIKPYRAHKSQISRANDDGANCIRFRFNEKVNIGSAQ